MKEIEKYIPTVELTEDQIRKAIKALKSGRIKHSDANYTAWMPSSIRGELDYEKYKGRGRPKKDDYIRIPYPDYLTPSGSLKR